MSAISDPNTSSDAAAPAACPKCGGPMRGRSVDGMCARCLLGMAHDPTPPSDDSQMDAALPDQFGRYTLRRQLGQGAMGIVYLAKDAELDRLVAIKVPQFGLGAEIAIVERFQREVRAAAAITHPNICPIYDVDEVDEIVFMTMAYIEGRPLSRYVTPERRLSVTQVVSLVRKLALALHAAHQRGIIHRDLKPANIMIDRRGEPIIMDFGLACRRAGDDEDPTRRGARVGTPSYMSPEQVAGVEATVASDQYSLGVILFELLTHELPFDGELDELIDRISHAPAPVPSQVQADVPEALDRICLRALHKDPEERFESLDELACELTRFLVSAQATSTDQPSVEQASQRSMTQKADSPASTTAKASSQRAIVGAIAIAVTITAILLAGLAQLGRPPTVEAPPVPQPLPAEVEQVEALEVQPTSTGLSDDPVVNTLLGRYLCFSEQDWEQGLTYLANGGDQVLQRVAELELQAKEDDSHALAVGDAWRDVALQQNSAETRQAMQQRASHWYEIARPQLTAGDRDRIDQWTAKLAETASAVTSLPVKVSEPRPNNVASVEAPRSVTESPRPSPSSTEPATSSTPDAVASTADAVFASETSVPAVDAVVAFKDPFAEQHRQALARVELQRRQMLAEMQELVAARDQRLPEEHVKATGKSANLVRLANELQAEIGDRRRRHGELMRRHALSEDPASRARIQFDLDSIRAELARAVQQYKRLEVEAKGHRQELRDLERELKEVNDRLIVLSNDAKQLVVDAFWAIEPTGSLGADDYDVLAVILTSWEPNDEMHPAVLALRALARCNQGDSARALDDAQRAVHLDPSFAFPLAVQGYARFRLGDTSDGMVEMSRAIRLDGKRPYGYFLRALAQSDAGKHSAAFEDASRVARLAEDAPWGHALRARLLAAAPPSELRDASAAIAAAEQSCRLSEERSWYCLDTLAAAYAEAGRFRDAAQVQRRALDLVPARFREECSRRLSLYQAERPYRVE